MKLPTLSFALLLVASSATAALAATPATQTLGGNAGLLAPMGDFAKAVSTGWFLGAAYDYRFNAQWAAGVDLEYFSFGEKSESVTLTGGTRTLKESAYGGQSQFYAKYFIPMKDDRFEPYLKAGYFHYRIGIKATTTYRGSTIENTDKTMKPGFGIGLGVTKKLDAKSRVGLELLYSQIETKGDALNLWQLGATYSFRLGK